MVVLFPIPIRGGCSRGKFPASHCQKRHQTAAHERQNREGRNLNLGRESGENPSGSSGGIQRIQPRAQPRQLILRHRTVGSTRRVAQGTALNNHGLGQSLPQLVRFFLPPSSRACWTPAEYGSIDLSNTFGGFCLDAYENGRAGSRDVRYFALRLSRRAARSVIYVTTVAPFLFWCSLDCGRRGWLAFPWVGRLIPGLPLFPFALLAVLSMFFYANQELQGRLVQAREQSGYAARLNIGRASISISLAVLCVLPQRSCGSECCRLEVASYGVLMLIAGMIYLRPELTALDSCMPPCCVRQFPPLRVGDAARRLSKTAL